MGDGVGSGSVVGVVAARAACRGAVGVVGGVPGPFGVGGSLLLREVFGEEASAMAAAPSCCDPDIGRSRVCRVLLRIVKEGGEACVGSEIRVVFALRCYLCKVAQCV